MRQQILARCQQNWPDVVDWKDSVWRPPGTDKKVPFTKADVWFFALDGIPDQGPQLSDLLMSFSFWPSNARIRVINVAGEDGYSADERWQILSAVATAKIAYPQFSTDLDDWIDWALRCDEHQKNLPAPLIKHKADCKVKKNGTMLRSPAPF